eukprot:11090015-Heterocapsa_arctica.AAC.1
MEIVLYLENKLMAPDKAEEVIEQGERGATPISSRDFQAAISMLMGKIDKLKDTNSNLMQEKMEETIRTKNI